MSAGRATEQAPGVPPGLKVAFYGDDFTGASDTLATCAQAGLRTLLFMGVPSAEQMAAAGPLDVLGIAGTTRSLAPPAMAAELAPAARFFATLGVPVTHYKICSTFDSAPQVGNIGAAVQVLLPQVESRFVPIVGGQPNLGRYCLFGNLFASAGLGGAVHRIDRHPTMSRHPVTPMGEADLRAHLAKQGLDRIRSMPYPDYRQPPGTLEAQVDAAIAAGTGSVLFDVASTDDLAPVGRAIWRRALQGRLLAIGPSSVEQALAAYWNDGALAVRASTVAPADGPVFVLSGSLSPVTAAQVGRAASYTRMALDAARMVRGDQAYLAETGVRVAAELASGRNVLAFTAPAEGAAPAEQSVDGLALARSCGSLLKRVLAQARLKRAGVSGGDTSSHALKALDAWGIEYAGALSHGVALCRLRSRAAHLDGLEIILKGGQMGPPDTFELLVHGT